MAWSLKVSTLEHLAHLKLVYIKTFCNLLARPLSNILLTCGALPLCPRPTVNLRAACLAKHWLRQVRYSIASGQVAPWAPTALLIVWTRARWQQHPSSVSMSSNFENALLSFCFFFKAILNLAFTFSLFEPRIEPLGQVLHGYHKMLTLASGEQHNGDLAWVRAVCHLLFVLIMKLSPCVNAFSLLLLR